MLVLMRGAASMGAAGPQAGQAQTVVPGVLALIGMTGDAGAAGELEPGLAFWLLWW